MFRLLHIRIFEIIESRWHDITQVTYENTYIFHMVIIPCGIFAKFQLFVILTGLHKLTEARVQVEEMSVDLEIKQDIVAKKQKECQELLVVIVEKRILYF